MRSNRSLAFLAAAVLSGCASPVDHFYRLEPLPDSADGVAAAAPSVHVHLSLTIPSLIDRPEMVLDTANNGVAILEHERWGETLADQVAQTVARDIERRRRDILVGDGRFGQSTLPTVNITVEIVRMSAERAGTVRIEAHWRIIDPHGGIDRIGADSFAQSVTARGGGDDYAGIARAYSAVLGRLAERLASEVPRS